MTSPLPEQYARLTLHEVLCLYGRRERACPPELRAWLDVARSVAELADRERSNRERRAHLA